MPIVPDDKNWTWVLERPCEQCGFTADDVDVTTVGELLRDNLAQWPELLLDARAGNRPDDATWSALEYGCHVRDVFGIFRTRLGRMLDEDKPLFANWDQDETAIQERYDQQDPLVVLDDLTAAGELLAAAFDSVHGEQWQRSGDRSDGARFTVESFARYFIHDPVHHVWDVRQGYGRS